MASKGTLYALIISIVSFISAFALIVNLIPAESYVQFKEYEDIYVHDMTGRSFLAYNQTTNITLASFDYTDTTIGDNELRFLFFPYSGALSELWEFKIGHLDNEFLGIKHFHQLHNPEGLTELKKHHILYYYDNVTDQSTFKMSCDHITINLIIRSNSSSYTLPDCLNDGHTLFIEFGYELNLNAMGTNIWTVLNNLFTFQTFETNNTTLNFLLNSLISVPLYAGIVYILYKLIAGIIPLVSGGGGA